MSDIAGEGGGRATTTPSHDGPPQTPGLVLPNQPSSPTVRTSPSTISAFGASPSGREKRISSTASSVASGSSLASLLTKLHHPQSASLSLEGKLKIRATVDCGSDVLSCKFSPDGSVVAASLRSGQVKFFTLTGIFSYLLQLPEDSSADTSVFPILSSPPATSIFWLPGGQPDAVLVTYSDGRVASWQGRNLGAQCTDGGVDVRGAVIPGMDGQVVTFNRKEVAVRDIKTLKAVTHMDQGVGGQLIGRGAWWAVSGRGRELVGGGNCLTWWDVRSGSVTRCVGGVHIRGPALSWHQNSNRIVSGSWGGGSDCVKIWEATTARLTHVLHSDSANTCVYSTTWAGKEGVAIGGSDPSLLRLSTLDNTTMGVMSGIRASVWTLDAFLGRGHQGTRLAVGCGPTLYLLDVLK
ncbi:uncharacterized protein [Macrobrachium rosenbergii]|uniref:uncharacterized protein n=1 Tax=Macrobrachium rosenbergii TaxID=79674 RepID=UPI0034D51883